MQGSTLRRVRVSLLDMDIREAQSIGLAIKEILQNGKKKKKKITRGDRW